MQRRAQRLDEELLCLVVLGKKLSGGGKLDACLRWMSDKIVTLNWAHAPMFYLAVVVQRVFCDQKRGLLRKCPRSVLTLSRKGEKRVE